jgi:hypothetical protein
MRLPANPKAGVYDNGQFPVDYAAKYASRNCEDIANRHLNNSAI